MCVFNVFVCVCVLFFFFFSKQIDHRPNRTPNLLKLRKGYLPQSTRPERGFSVRFASPEKRHGRNTPINRTKYSYYQFLMPLSGMLLRLENRGKINNSRGFLRL